MRFKRVSLSGDLRVQFFKEMCKIKVFQCGVSLVGALRICREERVG